MKPCGPAVVTAAAGFFYKSGRKPMNKTQDGSPKKSDRWFNIFCAVMIVLLLINTFVMKLAIVDGRSMYPTLNDRDLLLVLQLGYEPEQGDVVVIRTTDSRFSRKHIVKRVIAVAGQTVDIDYDANTVCVDGTVLSEPYLNYEEPDAMVSLDGVNGAGYTVPEGCVFVMGDNRNHSADSRSTKYGMIEESRIVGRVVLPVLP